MQGDYIYNHLRSLSTTSKLILILSLTMTFVGFLLFGLSLRSKEIVVLLLAFLQPFTILYFVYWRARRQHTSLDLVIKCFFVGFWFTTFQSVVIELLLQVTIFFLLTMATIGFDALFISLKTGLTPNSVTGSAGMSSNIWSSGISDKQSNFNGFQNTLNTVFKQFSEMHTTIFLRPTRMSYLGSPCPGVTMILDYQSQIQGYSIPGYYSAADYNNDGEISNQGDIVKAIVKSNLFVMFLGAFLMAFVVAAGVEETCKHFVVRCCPFVTPLKNPHAILGGSGHCSVKQLIQYLYWFCCFAKCNHVLMQLFLTRTAGTFHTGRPN